MLYLTCTFCNPTLCVSPFAKWGRYSIQLNSPYISWLLMLPLIALSGCGPHTVHFFLAKSDTRLNSTGIIIGDSNGTKYGTIQLFVDEVDPTKLFLLTALNARGEPVANKISIRCKKGETTVFQVDVDFRDKMKFACPTFTLPLDHPPEWLEGSLLIIEPEAKDGTKLERIEVELRRRKEKVGSSYI
jgi:hypothetical protein